jgi:hypothetical protein
MLLKEVSRTLGNKEVCEFFKKLWEEAEQGQVCCAAVIMAYGNHAYKADLEGHVGSEFALYFGLDDLKERLRAIVNNRQPANASSDVPANTAEHNLTEMSTSYDFLLWLFTAEMTRVREKAPPPLRVKFFCGANNKALDLPGRRQKFEGIMLPLVHMIGAVVDNEMEQGRRYDGISWSSCFEAVKNGEKFPQLSIPPETVIAMQLKLAELYGSRMPVTITLRESTTTPHRNSNVEEWIKFAKWLEERGERVLFVRDTEKADEPIEGFHTMPSASRNLFHRAALYECAKANLFVSNGPSGLGTISQKPSLVFQQVWSKSSYFPETPAGFAHFCGFPAGGQWPIETGQRIAWATDTFENIRDAWITRIEPMFEDAKVEAA